MKRLLIILCFFGRILRVYRGYYFLFRKMNPKCFMKNPQNLKAWRRKWGCFGVPFSSKSYYLFSNFVKENINICPLELIDTVIEPILNPIENRAFYSNKNMFDKLFDVENLPVTILRRMCGRYYDSCYKQLSLFDDASLFLYLQDFQKIIIKPAINSCSGIGICVFEKKIDTWVNNDNEKLSCSFLEQNYSSDFVIQNYLVQSHFMDFLNSSSINTIRVMTYRSISTDEIVIPNVIVRIGKMGACVDNAHAGGVFCGVSNDGFLCKFVCTYLGETKNEFNGINFCNADLQIPNFEEVLNFSKKIASCLIDQRLLALDIMLDLNNNPKLIEFNVGNFSAWLFQFTDGPVFGDYTDEIIKYCHSNMLLSKKFILH